MLKNNYCLRKTVTTGQPGVPPPLPPLFRRGVGGEVLLQILRDDLSRSLSRRAERHGDAGDKSLNLEPG
jgi:hypothetical protein